MIPKFDSSGVVCEMEVEQSHFGTNGEELDDGIDERKVYRVIDQLVPLSERGLQLETSETCAGVCETIREYKNVVINIISGGHTRLIRIKWRNRRCD